MSVDQPQTDSEDQDGHVQCLCCQHTDVRQWDVDHICQTGEKTQFLPPEKHPLYPWHILARVSNTEVLSRTNLLSMFTLLRQHRLRWLRHVYHMEDGSIPKDILYGELASGRWSKSRSQLRYKDICKRDMKALDINTNTWEDLAANCMMWRSTLDQHLKTGGKKLVNAEEGPAERNATTPTDQRPHINATFAAEIVSPTLVSTATSDAATIEQTRQPGCAPMIKLDRRRLYAYDSIGLKFYMKRSSNRIANTSDSCHASDFLLLECSISSSDSAIHVKENLSTL